jgi:hypothetical protein
MDNLDWIYVDECESGKASVIGEGVETSFSPSFALDFLQYALYSPYCSGYCFGDPE